MDTAIMKTKTNEDGTKNRVCYLFSSGVTGFTYEGKQQSTLQTSWFSLYLDHLSEKGLTDDEIMATEFFLPCCGESFKHAKPFRTSDGEWNWKIV